MLETWLCLRARLGCREVVAVPHHLVGSRYTIQGVVFCPTEDFREAAGCALSVESIAPFKTQGRE